MALQRKLPMKGTICQLVSDPGFQTAPTVAHSQTDYVTQAQHGTTPYYTTESLEYLEGCAEPNQLISSLLRLNRSAMFRTMLPVQMKSVLMMIQLLHRTDVMDLTLTDETAARRALPSPVPA